MNYNYCSFIHSKIILCVSLISWLPHHLQKDDSAPQHPPVAEETVALPSCSTSSKGFTVPTCNDTQHDRQHRVSLEITKKHCMPYLHNVMVVRYVITLYDNNPTILQG